MDLSQAEREMIYLEEKAKRDESCCSKGRGGALILLGLFAAAGMIGLLHLSSRKEKRKPRLEDLRNAYDGLSPDEML